MTEFPWEDNLLERKVESDLKDLLKTLVAFANSVKPSHTATILIGEKDDGTIQGVISPDNIQKKVRKECEKIYPPIIWRSRVYEKEGKYCVRVEIEYNGDTPHFGGLAWVRQGSETTVASDESFQKLIDLRSGIVRELGKWLNQEVTVEADASNIPRSREETAAFVRFPPILSHRWGQEDDAKILFVNNHWATFERLRTQEIISEPLKKITLSYDNKNNRLKVIVDY